MFKQMLMIAVLLSGFIGQAGMAQSQAMPADGPQYFSNSVSGTMWVYSTTDDKGCRNCSAYNSQLVCDTTTLGQTMKYRQPGTRDNDYIYTCVQANSSTEARLPKDGPNYFSNRVESFKWEFAGVVGKKCKTCVKYSPTVTCNQANVGVMMRSRQPNTKDNDYTYICRYSNN